MIPQILLGVALGLLAVGCSSKNTSPPRNPGRDPEGDPKYRLDFGEDLQAKWIHLELMKRGFSDVQLDKGCPTYQFPKPGGTFIKPDVGKGDRAITPCEVYEFTLNNYQDKKVRPLAERLAEKPIPWSLDDFDSKTTFDQGYREQIQGFINEIAQVLKKQNYDPGTPEYQERMAVALFVWIEMEPYGFEALMKDTKKSPSYKQDYRELKKDLENLGLEEIWETLKAGGLHFTGQSTEYTALEALRSKTGECTEHSKVLYAAFKMAGLDPFFISLGPTDSDHPELNGLYRKNPSYFHVLIGININGKTRLFDGALIDIDPPHRKYLQLSLRQYLSIDLSNRGRFQEDMENNDKAFHFFEMAKVIDPYHLSVYHNIANLYARLGENEKVIVELNSLLQINPYDDWAYGKFGDLFLNSNQLDKALESYNKAIQYQPKLPSYYIGRGLVFEFKGESEKASPAFIKALQMAPYYSYKKIVGVLKELYQSKISSVDMDASAIVESEFGTNLAAVLAHYHLSNYVYLAGQKETARKIPREFVKKLLARKEELNKEWTQYDPETLHTVYNLFEGLNPEWRKDPEVVKLWNSLQLPPRPSRDEIQQALEELPNQSQKSDEKLPIKPE